MRNRFRSTKSEIAAEANRLMESNNALSTTEQEMVLRYLAESNDGTNKLFLMAAALLHGVLGSLYLFLFLSRDRSLIFLLEPQRPQLVRLGLFVSAVTLLTAGIALAMVIPMIRLQLDVTNWFYFDSDEKSQHVRSEKLRLAAKFGTQRRVHLAAALVAACPAFLFLLEMVRSSEWEATDVLAAIWQPFCHLGMCAVLSWMQDTQLGVVQLLTVTYNHEKA